MILIGILLILAGYVLSCRFKYWWVMTDGPISILCYWLMTLVDFGAVCGAVLIMASVMGYIMALVGAV